MKRSELKKLKSAMEEMETYKEKSEKKLADDPHAIAEIMMRTMYGNNTPTGLKFEKTVGTDEEFTFKKNDLRPVIFSMLSKEDGRLYHCSVIFTTSEEVVKRRLRMNPFPVEPEVWQEMVKGDVLDVMILTTFNFEGKGYDFREQYAGLQRVNVLIKNLLNMEVPPEYAEDEKS